MPPFVTAYLGSAVAMLALDFDWLSTMVPRLYRPALGDKLASAGGQTGSLTLGVRPEGVLVSRDQQDGFMPVEAHIIEPLGSHDIVDLKVGHAMLRARTKSGFVARPGQPVWARIDPAQARRDIVKDTMRYAKRQMTWFRHQAQVDWFADAEAAYHSAVSWISVGPLS